MVLWIIENRPYSVLNEPQYSPSNSFGTDLYVRAKDLWWKNLRKFLDDPKVLLNAAYFFSITDLSSTVELVERGRALDLRTPPGIPCL